MTTTPPANPGNNSNMNPHFFKRETDGSVRLRLRLSAEEAALIEEGAGETPVILYIHRVLQDRAKYHKRKREEDLQRRGLSVDNFDEFDQDQAVTS